MAKKSRSKEIIGIFRANTKGFGFVCPEESDETDTEYYIDRRDTKGAMNGDRVRIRLLPPKRGKYTSEDGKRKEAYVTEILDHAQKAVIGTLAREAWRRGRIPARYYVVPDDRKNKVLIGIPEKDLGNASEGDKVLAEILSYPEHAEDDAWGKITEVFGDTDTKEANYKAILYENGIRTEFPEDVIGEAEKRALEPVLPDGRTDLRDKIIFTIDGADSKDLDDAISLDKTESGWILGVHIADVSHYVKESSVIDHEAFLRGTSLYFADEVVPMLPRALSNGICSLNGGEDRYALSAFVTLDKNGVICGCEIRETLIRSAVRGVYSELNDITKNGDSSVFYRKYAVLFPDLFPEMLRLADVLKAKNTAKGAIDLETSEAKIILDKNGYPTDIVKREQGITEKLIEQFMLCANEAVASWLTEKGIPCVYRVHEEPSPDKIRAFSVFAYQLGLDVRPLSGEKVTPGNMQSMMEEAKEKKLDTVVSTVLLRSLSKARYSDVHAPHFGLATDMYCHFTSPIRRYPDLTVHRFVKAVLHGKTEEADLNEMRKIANRSAQASTEGELRALNAERAIEDLYKVLYMSDRVGAVYDGIISSVTSFGFFVELENTCEGLVPITSLDGYYIFDEKNLTLTHGFRSYRLGQKVRVEIVHADPISRKIDMVLEEETDTTEGKTYAETRQTRGRRRKVR